MMRSVFTSRRVRGLSGLSVVAVRLGASGPAGASGAQFGRLFAAATTIDSTGQVGLYSSITGGADANPVISYYDGPWGDLKVVKCNEAACAAGGETITTVDSAGDVGLFTSITVGADANPVISYYDSTNGDLKVVKLGHTSWIPNGWGR